jgi:hypothetical protein
VTLLEDPEPKYEPTSLNICLVVEAVAHDPCLMKRGTLYAPLIVARAPGIKINGMLPSMLLCSPGQRNLNEVVLEGNVHSLVLGNGDEANVKLTGQLVFETWDGETVAFGSTINRGVLPGVAMTAPASA